MEERFRGVAVGGEGVFTGVGGSVGSDMERMRPSDAFAGEFCEAKGGGGGPLRAGVDGVFGGGAAVVRASRLQQQQPERPKRRGRTEAGVGARDERAQKGMVPGQVR